MNSKLEAIKAHGAPFSQAARAAVAAPALLFCFPGVAKAANFGFVRFPDWMDQYLLQGVAVTAIFFVLTYVTKPRGVPFNRLYRTRLRGLNRLFYNILYVTFAALMIAVFIGMGLQQAAE